MALHRSQSGSSTVAPMGASDTDCTMRDLWNRFIEPNVDYLVDNLVVGPNLRSRFSLTKLLTSKESEALEIQESPQDKANYFLFEILQFKEAEDFYTLCDVLRDAGRTDIVERMLGSQAKEKKIPARAPPRAPPPTRPKPVRFRNLKLPQESPVAQEKQFVPTLVVPVDGIQDGNRSPTLRDKPTKDAYNQAQVIEQRSPSSPLQPSSMAVTQISPLPDKETVAAELSAEELELKVSFHSFMIGKASFEGSSNTELELNCLLDINDEDTFLEGRVSFGEETVRLFLNALKCNKLSRVGLIAALQSLIIDSLKRKESLESFTQLLSEVHDHDLFQDNKMPEFVLDVTEKDIAIALLEVVPKEEKCRLMTFFKTLGYPLPLTYMLHPSQVSPIFQVNFEALAEVLPGASYPLILSLGTSRTGKTFLLKKLIARLSPLVDTELLDTSTGPTHDPSIDLLLDKSKEGKFTYADVHGWNRSLDFSHVIGTLASVACLILVHVSKEDRPPTSTGVSRDMECLLKEQLQRRTTTKTRVAFLLRDTNDSSVVKEFEESMKKLFPRASKITAIGVKNFLGERENRHDRIVTSALKELSEVTKLESPTEEENWQLPPANSLFEMWQAFRNNSPFSRVSMKTSLGEAVFRSLNSIDRTDGKLASVLFPLSTIQTEIAKTIVAENEIMKGLAKKQQSSGEKNLKEICEKRSELKRKRFRISKASPPLKLFADVIKLMKPKAFSEFQHYLEMWKAQYVKELYSKRKTLHSKIKELKSKKDPSCTAEIKKIEEEYLENNAAIDEFDISVDSFWAEIMHMYDLEALENSSTMARCCSLDAATARKVYLQYLMEGYAMQLLQGKPLQMADQFIKDVLEDLDRQHKTGDLFVVSVIGEQSSGKSTLLNSLFGCGFTTSSGKCTQGLFASFLRLPANKSLLVLDSEGLLSIEGGGRVFDGQITLLALACSDLVIINHKGEISSELNELLQVCLYAMDSLQVAKIKPNVSFVLRDQRNCRDEAVHQTALLKMHEAISKAVSESSKEVSDLIELGPNSLFLLHSAFSESRQGNRSIEIPSVKFSRETFLLRRKLVRAAEEGSVVLKSVNSAKQTSSPLLSWYHHACFVWKTLTEFGHSLLYCKTVQEIRYRQELGNIVNKVVKAGLEDESVGFKHSAALCLEKHRNELSEAEDSDMIDLVNRNFQKQLGSDMERAISNLQDLFDHEASGREYEDFKDSFKKSLSVPVRHEYEFQKETWKAVVDLRRKDLQVMITYRYFEEETAAIMKKTKYKSGITTEEAEVLFAKQWKEFEKEAVKRVVKKESKEQINAKVYELFELVAKNTGYHVENNVVPVPIVSAHKFEEDENFVSASRDIESWRDSYVEIKRGGILSNFLKQAKQAFQGSKHTVEELALDLLREVKSSVMQVLNEVSLSLYGERQEPFTNKFVCYAVNRAVCTAEAVQTTFSGRKEFVFRMAPFMCDFVTALMMSSIEALFARQKQNRQREKQDLAEEKDIQKRNFLAIVSKGQGDLERARTLAAMFKKTTFSSFVDAQLNDISINLRRTMLNIFGYDHKKAAMHAYEVCFGELNYRNIIKYCVNVNHFLYKMYSERFALEERKVMRTEGRLLLETVDEMFANLDKACQNWPEQVAKSGKGEIQVADFTNWLSESLKISTVPRVANYDIGNAEVFCSTFRAAIGETHKPTLQAIEVEQLPKTFSILREKLWSSCLKGCPHRCPRCGVKCEKEHNHEDNHLVSEKMHLFPSFNKWTLTRGEKRYVHLGMCLDPETRKNSVTSGGKEYSSVHEYLKAAKPAWLPFEGNADFSKPSENLKKAWVNCRRALIYMRTLGKDEIIDDTPIDWIEAYEEKDKEVTEEDLKAIQIEVNEE